MPAPDATYNQASIDIGGVRLKVQIADTPAMRERGLSGRESPAPFDGMLFLFEKPSTLWMKGMLFPIDIVWIASGQVADITENAQPDSYPQKFHPRPRGVYCAVEVPSGFVRQHHISIGDRVSL